MNVAPFSLERHLFRHVEVIAADEAVQRPTPLTVTISYGEHGTDPIRFKLTLEVRFGTTVDDTEANVSFPYSGKIVADGYFKVDDPTAPRARLIASCAGLVFGAIREMAISISSRGPYQPIIMKTLEFSEMSKVILEKHEEKKRASPDRNTAQRV